MLSRAVNVLTNLAVVPLSLGYLGNESFGLWMALTSFWVFLIYTDMGLGIGLQNRLSDCMGRDDRESPRYYVSSGLFVMGLLSLVAVAGGFWLLPHLNIARWVSVSDPDVARDVLPTAQAMLLALGVGLPAGMVQRIYNAHQRGYWAYLQLAAGGLMSLGGAVLCIWQRTSLPVLALVFSGVQYIPLLIGSVVLFYREPWLRPHPKLVRWGHAREILGTGLAAMWSQLASMLLVMGPALIIANRIAVSAVTPFSLTQKLLGVLTMVFTMSIWSLWPAYTEAMARDDWGWIRRTFWRTVWLSAIMLLPAVLLAAVAARPVIRIWSGDPQAVPSMSLLLAWDVWTLLRGWSVVCSIVLSGLHRLTGQAIYGLAFGIAGLGSGYVLAPHGVETAVWGMVIVGEGLRCVALSVDVAFVLGYNRKAKRKIAVEA
jgi:O-antigen/teichoic acid export membrane protein